MLREQKQIREEYKLINISVCGIKTYSTMVGFSVSLEGKKKKKGWENRK